MPSFPPRAGVLALLTAPVLSASALVINVAGTALPDSRPRLLEATLNGHGLPCAWRILEGAGCTLEADSGRFTPGTVRKATWVRVEAVSRADPRLRVQARFRLLPDPQGHLPEGVHLPFLNPMLGRRPVGFAPVRRTTFRRHHLRVAAGRPFTVRWTPMEGVRRQLLVYHDGSRQIGLDVTGRDHLELPAEHNLREVSVEGLAQLDDGAWVSEIQTIRVLVNGLLPFVQGAGRPGAFPGGRLQDPLGVASLGGGFCMVADPGGNALAMVNPEGRIVSTLGTGQAGYQDGTWARAEFREPSFLVSGWRSEAIAGIPHRILTGADRSTLAVADTGNHAIRGIGPTRVFAVAGVPGQAGDHDDPDPQCATFNHPTGLAGIPGQWLFIADRGNGLLRQFVAGLGVVTAAGQRHQRGGQDGPLDRATLLDPKGLALDCAGRGVYFSDGHAIRLLHATGEVITLAGTVDQAGFGDVLGAEPMALHGLPLLNDPWGLVALPEGLLIADRGNHAIRFLRLTQAPQPVPQGLFTLIGGGRDLPGLHAGVLNNGAPFRFPDLCGLEAPRGLDLVKVPVGLADLAPGLVLATGGSLALATTLEGLMRRLQEPPEGDPPWVALDLPTGLQVGEPATLAFTLTDRRPEEGELNFVRERTVAFRSVGEDDPTGGQVQFGEAHLGVARSFSFRPATPGTVRLDLTAIGPDGWLRTVTRFLEVRAADPEAHP